MQTQFKRDGFLILESLVSHDECDLISAEITPLFEQQQKERKNKIGGVRNLLHASSVVKKFANSAKVHSVLQKFNSSIVFPVRAIFFDKNPKTNWLVPWHQDLAIAVAEQIETSGFTGWSIKDGTPHVIPPREILDGMVAVRLHLDDCGANNGALKVIPGSHTRGKLKSTEISEWTKKEIVTCEIPKGGALLMRPLLLHSSSPAKSPSHRRILHIEYALHRLPNGLKWRDCDES